jgi:DtxR family Mn-dependent transcriptional regulator
MRSFSGREQAVVKITISKENYLKAIAQAEAEEEQVISATLARWLGVSPAAVTTATRRLTRDGLLRTAKSGALELTAEGRRIADRLRLRHQLIERMLTEIFGMEWYKVHDEAEQLEHAVSADFERKLIEKLGNGRSCPHGSRPAGDSPAARRRRGWITLDELAEGREGTIESVFERDRRLLEHFDRLGLRPGTLVGMRRRNSDDTVTLKVANRSVSLGVSAARRVWLAPGARAR